MPRRTPLKGLKGSQGTHVRFDDDGGALPRSLSRARGSRSQPPPDIKGRLRFAEAVESPSNGALRLRGTAVACGTRTVFSP